MGSGGPEVPWTVLVTERREEEGIQRKVLGVCNESHVTRCFLILPHILLYDAVIHQVLVERYRCLVLIRAGYNC